MSPAVFARRPRPTDVRFAILYSVQLAVACLISYWIATYRRFRLAHGWRTNAVAESGTAGGTPLALRFIEDQRRCVAGGNDR